MVAIIYLILFEFIQSIIVIPFSISIHKTPSTNEKYSITDFFIDYITRDLYTTIDIGTPPQKLFTIISSNSHIFSLSSDEYIPKRYEPNKNLNFKSKKSFIPSFSSSFSKIKNISIFSKKQKNKAIISESFILYNTMNLNKDKEDKDSNIKIDNMKIIFEEDNDEQKYAIIGLNYDTSNKEIPFIVNELKRLNIIANYDWSFRFISKTEGQFIIGGLPHNYENNKNYYNNILYTKILSSSAGDYSYPWSIHFNQLYFMNNDKKFIISQITKCSLDPNLGFIMGNSKYKKFLLDNYFNVLIENNICQIEKTEQTKYNKSFVFYGTNGVYEFFTCDKNKFTNEKINYKKQFMPLLFDLPKYNYIFNLNDNDLFTEINDKYYFLVAFPENEDESFYIPCFLGLPFYQKYRLVFNFDSKTIGFYNQDPNINNIDANENINDDNNNQNKENNISNESNYKRIILEIFICAFLILVAFFIGKKINEQRKKRANELKDDNYEYILDNNKDVNNVILDLKNLSAKEKNKIMEMSSNII